MTQRERKKPHIQRRTPKRLFERIKKRRNRSDNFQLDCEFMSFAMISLIGEYSFANKFQSRTTRSLFSNVFNAWSNDDWKLWHLILVSCSLALFHSSKSHSFGSFTLIKKSNHVFANLAFLSVSLFRILRGYSVCVKLSTQSHRIKPNNFFFLYGSITFIGILGTWRQFGSMLYCFCYLPTK